MPTPPVADLLPPHHLAHVVAPSRFTRHDEPSARAILIRGYTDTQRACFHFHTYTLLEDRFDCDDQPYQLATYVEQVIAWRLDSGKWLRRKLQRTLGDAGLRNTILDSPAEIVDECAL